MLSIEREYPYIVRDVRQYTRFISDRLDEGRGIWFTGRNGTGKTTLAMLVSKAALEADRTVAIYSLPRLLSLLRATYDDGSRYSLSGLISRLCAVDLLHIDDVGAQQTSAWVLEQLYTIVNTRYEDCRALMLTTNLVNNFEDDGVAPDSAERGDEGDDDGSEPDHPAAPLRRQIGRRTVSRIYEICGEPHTLLGEDHRMKERWEMSDEEGYTERAEPPAEPPAWDPFDDSTWEEDGPRYGRPRSARTQPLD